MNLRDFSSATSLTSQSLSYTECVCILEPQFFNLLPVNYISQLYACPFIDELSKQEKGATRLSHYQKHYWIMLIK